MCDCLEKLKNGLEKNERYNFVRLNTAHYNNLKTHKIKVIGRF